MPGENVKMKVMGAISLPRLGFTPNFVNIVNSVGQMGIDMQFSWSYDWEISLSHLLYKAERKGVDIVVTIDYDSLFSVAQLYHMLSLMASFPEADIIFPVQAKRETEELICVVPGVPVGEKAPIALFQQHLTESQIGHFGLTAIRMSRLVTAPHPWFWKQPNKEGRWEEGDMNADIWFWDQIRKAPTPLRAFQANGVRIAHIQQVATIPDVNLQLVHHYITKMMGEGFYDRLALDQYEGSPAIQIPLIERKQEDKAA